MCIRDRLEAQQYLVPEKFYIAGRYTNSQNDTDTIEDEDTLQRLQIAAGYWVNPKTLAKFEIVAQDEEVNSGGQIGEGFSGFISEVSVKF